MRHPFKVGGFEKRLLVFFLLLSVTPTLLIAIFGARYFTRSVELVSNPALEQSLQNSVEIAKELSAKLEQDARTASIYLAEELRRRSRPGSPRDLEALLKTTTQEANADFAALYTLQDTSWALVTAYPERFERIDTHMGLDRILTQAQPQSIGFRDRDIIASGVLGTDDSLFVAGYILETGFMSMMRETGEDLSRYRSVKVYVSILRRYMLLMIFALVAIMAISSAIVSRLLARRISYPIQELAHATDRIAKGDLGHRVSVNARDEIRSLVSSFNNMTQELLESKRNLIRAERIAAWRDVARRIAHEIKNPLTPIEIAIHRLKKRVPGDTKDKGVVDECLDSILKEVTTLKTIAQEFSSFAKLPEPKFEDLDLNEALRSVLGLYASSLDNIDVSVRFGSDLPQIKADSDQLRSLLSNLIKNAIEAMPDSGKLTITTSLVGMGTLHQEKHVRIEISDTGGGIPEDIKEKIFDPYFTTKPTGTGLGLALVYRILEDHGGRITFVTGSRGTTFTVNLRVKRTKAE